LRLQTNALCANSTNSIAHQKLHTIPTFFAHFFKIMYTYKRLALGSCPKAFL
jgi:hypothetical protein